MHSCELSVRNCTHAALHRWRRPSASGAPRDFHHMIKLPFEMAIHAYAVCRHWSVCMPLVMSPRLAPWRPHYGEMREPCDPTGNKRHLWGNLVVLQQTHNRLLPIFNLFCTPVAEAWMLFDKRWPPEWQTPNQPLSGPSQLALANLRNTTQCNRR